MFTKQWSEKLYGTKKVKGFESDCKTYDIMPIFGGMWRLTSIAHEPRAADQDVWMRDFKTLDEAKEYAEKM